MRFLCRQKCLRGALWPLVYADSSDIPFVQACGGPEVQQDQYFCASLCCILAILYSGSSLRGFLLRMPILRTPGAHLPAWDIACFPQNTSHLSTNDQTPELLSVNCKGPRSGVSCQMPLFSQFLLTHRAGQGTLASPVVYSSGGQGGGVVSGCLGVGRGDGGFACQTVAGFLSIDLKSNMSQTTKIHFLLKTFPAIFCMEIHIPPSYRTAT